MHLEKLIRLHLNICIIHHRLLGDFILTQPAGHLLELRRFRDRLREAFRLELRRLRDVFRFALRRLRDVFRFALRRLRDLLREALRLRDLILNLCCLVLRSNSWCFCNCI